MTIRDKVREMNPKAINAECEGGVEGCPDDYPGLEGYNLKPDGCCADDNCDACWSQEYREEPEVKPKKKFSASVVFTVLAVLEAAASAVAVVFGDSYGVRFCCMMGLLYLIAAGVWRDNR